MSSEPRAVYVHVPFCRHRCGYCNFTLVADRDELIDDYLRAIEIELQSLGTTCAVDTLFLGGGTPSHLPLPSLARLLDLTTRYFPLRSGGEFSLEANPSDLTPARVDCLATHGVNRLSLGAQSFDARKLTVLERDHQADTIRLAVELALPKMHSVALDLIFGVPGETIEVWQSDLNAALDLGVQHLSTYGLTFERGTRFWSRRIHGQLEPLDESVEAAMYEYTIDRLTQAGWDHYEVSNFARPGYRCRHNEVYWTGGQYHAVGPGAASFVDGVRRMNHRSTTTYLKRVLGGESPVAEFEQLPPEEAARERLVFALRRLEGIDLAAFQQQTGFEVRQLLGETWNELTELGMIDCEGEHLRLTRRGLLVSDTIFGRMLTQ